MSLSLDARRRAMLAEMGVNLPPLAAHEPPTPEVVADDVARAQVQPTTGVSVSRPTAPLAIAPAPASRPPPPMPGRPHVAAPPASGMAVSSLASRPPAGPVAHLSWTDLQQAVATCEGCSLCQQRRNTVFGTGAPDPTPGEAPQVDWMIVGEAPGENEDLQGEPFVGQAGRLLDNMLKAVGLERHAAQAPGGRVYIANVLKCRPPGNRNPHPDEVARCEPYLRRQVALLRPRIIVAMGRFAVQSLLRDSVADVEAMPLGRLRGQVYAYEGVPVVVTYHPAYLLRNLIDKRKAWADLCLALSVANRPQS